MQHFLWLLKNQITKNETESESYPVVDGHEEDHSPLRKLSEQREEHPGQQESGPLSPQSGQQDQRQEGHVEVDQGQQIRRNR